MAERSYSGDALDLSYSSGPWARDGETVDGSTDDDTGEEHTVGTPDPADMARSKAVEGDPDDANPGFEGDKTDLGDADRRDELRDLVNAVGRSMVLDCDVLGERYGVSPSVISGDLARIERDRWRSEDYEVVSVDAEAADS